MITEHEIKKFEQDGAVTIDTPFTRDQLEAASAAFDRLLPFVPPKDGKPANYRIQRTNDFFDHELLEFIQHPFVEDVARKALHTDVIDFFATAIVKTYPEPGKEFSFWEHVDIKYSTSDLDAVPKRMICSCLIWFTDVTMDRAPLMCRPGSHRLIGAHVEAHGGYIDNPVGIDKLPKLPYADPVPLLARKGQMTVCTTALIHGASVNTGQRDRKVMFIPVMAKGFGIRANMAGIEARNRYIRELRNHFRPDRLHILPDVG